MRLALFACGLVVAGCIQYAAHYDYVPTTQTRAAPKPENCDFELLTTRPDRPYDELGIVEPAVKRASSVVEFRDRIRADVCRAGGDAVLSEIGGSGLYERGTVIRYRGRGTAAGG
jgi:hypothetical protein